MTSSEIDVRLGQRIRNFRRANPALTTIHIADHLGIAESEVLAMEDGRVRPTARQIILLAELLDVLPSWLFKAPADGH